MKYLGNIDLQGLGELQNATIQNLSSAPSTNLKEGRFYWNSAEHTGYIYDGTNWKDIFSGIPIATSVTLGGVIIGSNISVANDGTISVADASTSAKGVIEIATDSEASTGTSETLAVNPKQLATKVTANTAITGATKCKITYDSKGLVTAGADLADTDIPNLSLSKITDVTATATEVNVLDGITATTAELNILDGVTATAAEINVLDGITATTTELNYVDGVTSSIQDQLNGKIGLTGLSIASGSANYLTYDNTLGEFGAKVDTTVTASSTNLVTSGAVKTAIDNAVVGGVTYVGTWDITSATDYSGITLPVSKGDLFYVTGTGPVSITAGGTTIEWNAGDFLIVNADVAAGGTLTNVSKIDNTESTDIVRLNATQTLTNKTIDCATSGTGAGNNTITNLPFSALASGAVVNSTTGIAAASSASDSKLPTEKAVASAIADFITASSTTTFTNKTFDANGTGNSISNLETADFASGVIQTTLRASSSASDSALASEKAVATAVEAVAANNAKVYSEQNGALTATGGQVTWTVTHGLGGDDVIARVYEASSGQEIHCDVALGSTSGTVVIKLLAAADVAANTYKVVVVGGNYVAPQA